MTEAPYMKLPADDGDDASVPLEGGRDAHGLRFGAWDVPLFACFTHLVPNCLMATCLQCVSVAQIAHRLNIARFGVIIAIFVSFQVLITVLSILADPKDPHPSTISVWPHLPLTDELTPLQVLATQFGTAYWVGTVLFNWHLRSKTRQRCQIPGSPVQDGCTVLWCSWCAVAQMATQVRSYEPGHCDFGPPDVLPPCEQ